MTKIESIQWSLTMWTWLRDQTRKGHYYEEKDWFKETENEPVEHESYFCQYALDVTTEGVTCRNCPIKEWREHNSVSNLSAPSPCCQSFSPYYRWEKGIEEYKKDDSVLSEETREDILRGSEDMVFLLEKELKNMKRKEGQKND